MYLPWVIIKILTRATFKVDYVCSEEEGVEVNIIWNPLESRYPHSYAFTYTKRSTQWVMTSFL